MMFIYISLFSRTYNIIFRVDQENLHRYTTADRYASAHEDLKTSETDVRNCKLSYLVIQRCRYIMKHSKLHRAVNIVKQNVSVRNCTRHNASTFIGNGQK